MIELLAPAGNEKSFYQAVNSGANAVYLGLSDFSARKNAENFNSDNIRYFVSYAHAFGVKVYLAVNTLVKDGEMDKLLATVETGYLAGVDAFILQDIFLGRVLKARFPDICLHLSTQAGINEIFGAQMAKNEGFERVILARETPLTEIKKITKIIETEVFCHGALCTCFSGHCYMSSFIGGNSGNRGFCKQPCRKEYKLEGSSLKGKYAISLSDLCLADEIDALKKAGVSSIKIEGRMRSPEYVGAAVKLYRRALDGMPCYLSEIKRTFNRGDYTKGYLYGVDKNILSTKIQNHKGELVGKIIGVNGDTLKTDRFCISGDAFKILSDGFEVGNAICVKDGKLLKFKGKVKVGDDLTLTKDQSLTEKKEQRRLKRIFVSVRAVTGDKLEICAEGISLTSDSALDRAKSAPTSVNEVKENLLKVDKYPFEIACDIYIEGEPFIPKGVLNRLRSTLYEKVFYGNEKTCKNTDITEQKSLFYESRYTHIIMADRFVDAASDCAFVLHPSDYADTQEISGILSKIVADKYLFVPSFLPGQDKKEIEGILEMFDGIYADGLSGVELAKKHGKKLIGGLGLNCFNSYDLERLNEISTATVLSQELSLLDILNLGDGAGHKFAFGSIRLMELIYCPFGRSCKDCKRDGEFYTLSDEMGHKFKIRRYRLGGKCRFEVYNEEILLSAVREYCFYNFIGLSDEIISDFRNEKFKDIRSKYKTTSGNLKRGVN